MSKDILGSLVRVLITVPEDRLGLVQDVALKLSSDDGDQWVSPLKQFLRKEPCWNDQSVKQSETVLTNRLKKLDIGNVPVAAMSRMKTADCLKKGITYRDGDLDNWLSDYIPAIGGGSLGGFELTDKNGTTYRQMAESLLQTTGSDESLKKLLKERGHTFHLEQVADLIRRTKAGEKTGLLDNGYANLLFVEDENGEVFGLHALWLDDCLATVGTSPSTASTATSGGMPATVSSPATRFELLDPWKLGSARGCSQEQPLLIL